MIKEFQEFIAKGNVMDLAVGVIIGGAFGLIVKSLTDDLIMPIVGAIFGGFDFSNYFLPLASNVTADTLEAAREQVPPAISAVQTKLATKRAKRNSTAARQQ